jgi:hypothetical protein
LAVRRTGNEYTVLGVVAARVKDEVTVTMLDGGIQVLPRQGLIFFTVGSLPFFQQFHPGRLAQAFAEAPGAVYEQALVDAGKELTVGGLKDKLVQSGIDRDTVDKSWPDAKKRLESHPTVATDKKANGSAYRWDGDRATRLRASSRRPTRWSS